MKHAAMTVTCTFDIGEVNVASQLQADTYFLKISEEGSAIHATLNTVTVYATYVTKINQKLNLL